MTKDNNIHRLALETLPDLENGAVALQFDELLKRITDDCRNRPADDRPRKLTLILSVMPKMEPGGDCTEVEADIKIKCDLPPHQTKTYSLGLWRAGLVWNELSLEDINQQTLDLDEE